jgi:hypothetical protein
MLVESDQSRLSTLWRGLLCMLLTLVLALPSFAGLEDPIEIDERDRVSAGDDGTSEAWISRGTPRIAKRPVGDHLAIQASFPDAIALAPCEPWSDGADEPRRTGSSSRHRGASVRGPPRV